LLHELLNAELFWFILDANVFISYPAIFRLSKGTFIIIAIHQLLWVSSAKNPQDTSEYSISE
jgi:hypothetical protein